MPISQPDRLAFSLSIVSAAQQVKGLDMAKAQLQTAIDAAQALDDGNMHLAAPGTALINGYQSEWSFIDGNIRTTFSEQDITDSAAKKLGNFFFPNNVQATIPDLASSSNIWTKLKPFALAYGVGKNYAQAYSTGPSEQALIAQAIALITADISGFTDIQLTSGQHCVNSGTCSLPGFTTEATCVTGGGIWTPGAETIEAYPDVQTAKTTLVAKIAEIANVLVSEGMAIVQDDPNSATQAQNEAAMNAITTFAAQLTTWVNYADFNTAHGQTTCAGFNAYDANLLAPTKLHVANLNTLLAALNARLASLTTRVAQLNTNLGAINQDLTTGEATGTGLYYRRFQFLSLRLNALNGSATKLQSLKMGSSAQDGIKASILEAKGVYLSVLPTTLLTQSGSDTANAFLTDPSLFSPGDTIYVVADGQDELVRAIKSINGSAAVLNDSIPTKYRTTDNLRVYKDLT